MNRFFEPSSFAGYAALAQIAKAFLPLPYHGLMDCLAAGLASVAVAKPEAGSR